MTENSNGNGKSRRTFLKEVAAYSGGIAIAGYATGFSAPLAFAGKAADVSTAKWAKQAGLELFTVRDVMTDPKTYVSHTWNRLPRSVTRKSSLRAVTLVWNQRIFARCLTVSG